MDRIYLGDTNVLLDKVADNEVDLIITSPPYWAKRTYNGEGELGTEETPELFVKTLADMFDRMRRVLKPEGNLFVNIGDTFFGSGAGAYSKYYDENGCLTEVAKSTKERFLTTKPLQPKIKKNGKLYQNKQLLLIPARFAVEMQDRGWILRDDIIWHKPNRIPSGVKDRFICTYEHVYHFVQQSRYFFDLDPVKVLGKNGMMKNPGDVWSINTQGLPGPHTATFPEELVRRIILCASPQDGVVFDPFLGVGTTWVVSRKLGRGCIGMELNKEYLDYAMNRVWGDGTSEEGIICDVNA